MSSPASRKRQRHRRRAEEKIWKVQTRFAERLIDLTAYDRVLTDMKQRYSEGDLSPFCAPSLSLIATLRDAVKQECDQLAAEEAALIDARAKLAPPSDPKETLSP